MRKTLYFCVVSLLLILLYSCDKVDPPYMVKITPDTSTTTHVRKILLEDYTGHNCIYCPAAGVIAEDIKSSYGNKVVLLTVHAGGLSNPPCSVGGGYPSVNFQTTAGSTFYTTFGMSATPNGMINRIYVDGYQFTGSDNWLSKVDSLVKIAPDAYIDITNTYIVGTRTLNIAVNSEFLHDTSGIFKLSVFIKGDSISWQQIPTGIDPNYHHHNVLCKEINGTWGDTLASGIIPADTVITKSYNVVLPTAWTWNVDNCYVVAFIYNATTNVVVQAEEKKIK